MKDLDGSARINTVRSVAYLRSHRAVFFPEMISSRCYTERAEDIPLFCRVDGSHVAGDVLRASHRDLRMQDNDTLR